MRINKNKQDSQQKDTNSGEAEPKPGFREDARPYDKIINKQSTNGLSKYRQPPLDPASIDEMEADELKEEATRSQITDDELTDANLHGNTF